VDEKKNLHGAIQMLDGVRGDIRFDIYGPVTDAAYWARCQALLARLPANVRTRYHGPLSHDQVPGALAAADVFLFPTLGENFGHVIIEALVQGCPVLTSDQTPWRALAARRAGWDLPLARPSAFRDALQRLADMDDGEYRPWSAGALAMGTAHAADSQAELSNRELFRRAADGGASARTRTATAPVPRSAPVSHRPAPASHRPAPGQTAGTIL
jgi:glycosyltransferase involved in cell wall biosynthesis